MTEPALGPSPSVGPSAPELVQTGDQEGAPFPVAGIGASAGGLEACTRFLRHLSPDLGLAFVFIHHLDPAHPSDLVELLARASSMPVQEAVDGTAVQPNRIYVIPPNATLTFSRGRLRLAPRPRRPAACTCPWTCS